MRKIPIFDKEDMEICAMRENVLLRMPQPVALKMISAPHRLRELMRGTEQQDKQ